MGNFLNKAKRALGSKTTYTAKPAVPQSRAKKGDDLVLTWGKKKKAIKQYGDKGYRPSSGRGVGM